MSNHHRNNWPPLQRLLTIRDAARYCGMGRSTLYAEAAAGRLTFVKIGAATRIEVAELDRWIDARAVPTKAA